MRAADIIIKKRNGGTLSETELRFFIDGYVNGDIPDYQAASWLMAVFFRGMNPEETGELTRLMMQSGTVLDLSSLKGPLIDKHSTGGVGDKTSLILAPIAAACGLQVPMMSGRALGHTGGTLDKLESLKGYNIRLNQDDVIRIIRESGYGIMGQTAEVVPADRKMYALRDVTGTVESIPLITASILSKKLAEGAEGLVFDVKCGAGAFMKTEEQALELAQSLVHTGRAMGRKIIAVITSMEEPLGRMVGNFLEVEEAWECLQGKGPEDLMGVTLTLASRMLLVGGICSSPEEALSFCREKIDNGEAAERFLRNMEAQGADPFWFKMQAGRWRAPVRVVLEAEEQGYITGIDAFETGMCAVGLGVGRSRAEDPVEPHTGIHFFKKTGDSVQKGEALCEIFAINTVQAQEALNKMKEAVTIGRSSPGQSSLILREIK
jgi:pyrimidine-nucleoside phosphorylase